MQESEFIIDIKNLDKSFNNLKVVDNVSLQVRKGKIYGFLGPNGSGKTTTIRMICGLLQPDNVNGHCLGYDIIKDAAKIKKQVGYMTQSFSLYKDLTVKENLEFTARLYEMQDRKRKVQQCLDRLKFGKVMQKNLAGSLSGGWRQRLALASAMLHEPKLLLLDEPTARVDPKARREFWDQLHLLASDGITALVSTHYMDEAERCHKLAYIVYGKILTRGTVSQIIKSSGLHTWVVEGKQLNTLRNKLEEHPNISQVAPFGNALHIIGKNEKLLEKAVESFQDEKYKWRKDEPNLEDVFINLVQKAAPHE